MTATLTLRQACRKCEECPFETGHAEAIMKKTGDTFYIRNACPGRGQYLERSP